MRFSHVYLEEKAQDYEMTSKILSNLNDSTIIPVKHYKDVFNRRGQNNLVQSKNRKLIIGINEGTRIYKGAPVCQDFGVGDFYYTASVMNCVFDCDYCFLKGMYPSSNIVIFVNFDDYAADVKELLRNGPVYLCISYDTDILALESLTGMTGRWISLAKDNPELTLEIRTKSAPSLRMIEPMDNIIYAFSLSPDEIVARFEHYTAPLDSRLDSVAKALDAKASVRLCFDPMIYVKDYDKVYGRFMDKVMKSIDLSRVKDMSIGTFRISEDYIDRLKKSRPDSACVLYPFIKKDGYLGYPDELKNKMIGIVKDRLTEVTDENRIFVM